MESLKVGLVELDMVTIAESSAYLHKTYVKSRGLMDILSIVSSPKLSHIRQVIELTTDDS